MSLRMGIISVFAARHGVCHGLSGRSGGSWIKIDNVIVIQRGESHLLQGIVSSGTFKVGLGDNLKFTVGDRFYLWISHYTDKNLLVLVNSWTYWYKALTWF